MVVVGGKFGISVCDANNSPKHARIDMEIRSPAQMAKKQLLKMAKKKKKKCVHARRRIQGTEICI